MRFGIRREENDAMRYQWKLLLLLLALAMGPMAVMRPFGLHAIQDLGQTLVSSTQESLLRQTQDRLRLIVAGYSEVLRTSRTHAVASIQLQAQEVEQLMARAAPPSQPLFVAGRLGGGDPIPDLTPSDIHIKRGRAGHVRSLPVSYRTPVFKFSPGVDPAALDSDCQRLAGMAAFWQTIATQEHSIALWHFVTLDSGVHMTFPGHDSFPRRLDPRERFSSNRLPPHEISWVGPYLDPVTRQVVTAAVRPIKGPSGAIVGVTGMVLPINNLMERPFLIENLPVGTAPFICHLEGEDAPVGERLRIMARQEHSEQDLQKNVPRAPRHWGMLMEPEWLAGDDAAGFEAMLKDIADEKENMRRMDWKGADSLWTYGVTHPGTVLVLVTPYAGINQMTAAADRKAANDVQRIARSTLFFLTAVCGVTIILAILFAKTVTRPLKRLSDGAQRLAAGDFNARVEVHSRDEFGQMAKIFNQVGPELKAHYDLRRSLDLAREVQQNLLPKDQPQVAGLDVHGQSRYCDQTGGDYYDYLVMGPPESPRLIVIVGDVAGHGISSALLMATARALIRQRLSLEGRLAEKLAEVNRFLCEDVGDSGQFMTLFVAEIDPVDGRLLWVRAGHEPGWRYDPTTDTFETVAGQGVPMGAMEASVFQEQALLLNSDDILLIGTDGIWEALNPAGAMFGKKRLEALVRGHAHLSARAIVEAVMTELDTFRQGATVVDDATLVVVKRTAGLPI